MASRTATRAALALAFGAGCGGPGPKADAVDPDVSGDGGGGGFAEGCPDGAFLNEASECEPVGTACSGLDCESIEGSWPSIMMLGRDARDPCTEDPGEECTPVERGTLSIFVVDIGQGDSTLVLGPVVDGRRRALLMDAGNRAPDGGDIVGALLTELGIAELDYVVLSHFDGDHIGGFVTISGSTSVLWHSAQCEPTGWFPTQVIYDQGTDTNQSNSSAQWLGCVPPLAQGLGVTHARVEGGAFVGTEMDLGMGTRATIVAGDGYVLGDPNRVASVNTPNERSIALLVSNDDGFDFLVTGDLIGRVSGAENASVEGALGAALKARGVTVEVLRAGHHGAANASEPGFLLDIAPEVVVVSTGDDQPSNYHHPRCATYQSFDDAGIEFVLQTERGNSDCAEDPPVVPTVINGTIRIDATGDVYTFTNDGAVSPANGEPTQPLSMRCTVAGGC